MNRIERIIKLKRFIEIVDKQVFPKNPIPVSVWRRGEYPTKEGFQVFASFQDNSREKMDSWYGRQKFIFIYYYIYLRYLVKYLVTKYWRKDKKDLRFFEAKMIRTIFDLRFYKVQTESKRFYNVIPPKASPCFSDYDFIFLAVHEVRHRVQKEKRYYTLSKKLNIIMETFYMNEAKSSLEEEFRKNSFYDTSQEFEEVDANFIGNSLKFCAKKYFNNADSISETDFRLFMKKYSQLLTWKNPSIGQ